MRKKRGVVHFNLADGTQYDFNLVRFSILYALSVNQFEFNTTEILREILKLHI